MQVAVLGGGFTGLSAAYYLQKKGHEVTLFEKEEILGGLAVGFKTPIWDWYLERAYHHLFANDHDILNFAREIEFEKIYFRSPETASFYAFPADSPQLSRTPLPPPKAGFEGQVIPLDTPQDLLKFPHLKFPQKIRTGLILAFLKFSPPLVLYERYNVEEFLIKFMGRRAYEVLFKELLRKKFGKYAGNILMSFFWARIKKRTKKLGYVEGGFQALIDFTERKLIADGAIIKKGVNVGSLKKKGEKFIVDSEEFDAVVATLPSPILAKVTAEVLPKNYLARFKKLKFLHAVVLILETEEKFLDKTYWLNVCTDRVDIMGIMQHTNMTDKAHYGGNNILYVANYVDSDDPLFKMTDGEILNYYLPQLRRINPNFKFQISNQAQNPKSQNSHSKFQIPDSRFYVFRAPFSQPVFDRDFLKNKPDFITPVKNFYIANLDMTYPYDRGVNYAVKLGKRISDLIR